MQFYSLSHILIHRYVTMRISHKITLIYLLAGIVWILVSDYMLLLLIPEAETQLSLLQTVKGFFFVLFTAGMLYFLIEYYIRSLNQNLEELRKLNQSLDEQAERLLQANKELEQFAYVTSHDLQEPLRMISSFLTQLQRKYGNRLDDKARTYIGFAMEGATRMKKIIEDIFDFYNADANPQTEHVHVNLNEVVEECLLEHRRQIRNQEASFDVGTLPQITSSRHLMHYLFNAFIDNSLLFSKKGVPPVISIQCDQTGADYRFCVKDNGIGIEPEYQKQIFVIFKRLHSKDDFPGTGIGLALAQKIIHRHGGKLNVTSDGSSGSQFEFTLNKAGINQALPAKAV